MGSVHQGHVHQDVDVYGGASPNPQEGPHRDVIVVIVIVMVAQGRLGCPQQINGDDCGVYVVALMLCLLLDYEPDFTPIDIAAFRTKLAMWTLAGAADL